MTLAGSPLSGLLKRGTAGLIAFLMTSTGLPGVRAVRPCIPLFLASLGATP